MASDSIEYSISQIHSKLPSLSLGTISEFLVNNDCQKKQYVFFVWEYTEIRNKNVEIQQFHLYNQNMHDILKQYFDGAIRFDSYACYYIVASKSYLNESVLIKLIHQNNNVKIKIYCFDLIELKWVIDNE